MCTIFHLLAVAVKYEPEYTNNTWKEKKEGKGGVHKKESIAYKLTEMFTLNAQC